ncbi:MAG TPA: adenosylcobinamide-phosphate synthase CbiB [Acidimicrobiales bacterium]|nr:adenosylcobinamide-phosphate synthase CbiB [Acidimicrobiales bacterium]
MIATLARAARTRAAGAGLGVLIDRVGGEPPEAVHPVAWFGRAMTGLESLVYADRRSAGVGYAAIGLSIAAAAGLAVGSTTAATAAATATAVAGRALAEVATAVGDALRAGDLERARTLVPSLVGRDPAMLDTKDLARAVVESVAENTVDAVVAPALWGAVAGAPGTLGCRGVNTLDAMVGYRSERYERFGWASARLDDVAAYVPARLTAGLVMAVRPRSWRAVARAVATQAPAHPSPNAGVAEAAFAAALRLRLGGRSVYHGAEEFRPALGDGAPPEPVDIARAVALSRDVSSALVGLLVVVALGQGFGWQPDRRRGR